jgi:plastocyanin
MRLFLLAAAFAALACSGDDNGSPTDNNGGPDGDIAVGNNFFDPATFNSTVGTPVVWAWVPGAVVHNVVFDDQAPGSGDKSSGTFVRTFTAAGTYGYHCSIHGAAMSGVVNVAASGQTGGSGGGGGGGGGGGSGGGGGYDY